MRTGSNTGAPNNNPSLACVSPVARSLQLILNVSQSLVNTSHVLHPNAFRQDRQHTVERRTSAKSTHSTRLLQATAVPTFPVSSINGSFLMSSSAACWSTSRVLSPSPTRKKPQGFLFLRSAGTGVLKPFVPYYMPHITTVLVFPSKSDNAHELPPVQQLHFLDRIPTQ